MHDFKKLFVWQKNILLDKDIYGSINKTTKKLSEVAVLQAGSICSFGQGKDKVKMGFRECLKTRDREYRLLAKLRAISMEVGLRRWLAKLALTVGLSEFTFVADNPEVY